MNNKNKKGFTMIELMITVAIVGALTAIAIPAYQDYVIRSQVSEGITLASGAKPLVLEYYANNGEYPKNNQDVGYGGAVGKFVSNVEIRNDSIVATLSNKVNSKIAGKKVVLTTTVNEGTEIKLSFLDKILGVNLAYADSGWSCYSDIEQKYLPKNCESRKIIDESAITPPEDYDLWGGSGQQNFKIRDDKPYRIKDFNLVPFSSGGSVLDLSDLVNGDLNKITFEKSDGNTIVKIDGLTSIITLENVDLSQNGMLNSEQIKNFLQVRGKLIV